MDRRQEIMAAVKNNTLLKPLVEEMVDLEQQLEYLRTLPKIRVHPKDPSRQKATPAARQYQQLLQQYSNVVKIMIRAAGQDQTDEESPLRRWFNEHSDQKQDDLDS